MDIDKIKRILIILFVISLTYFFSSSLQYNIQISFILLIFAASLWVTELLPLGITGLIIAFMQPLLGIQSFEAALALFFAPTIILLLGGFF